MKTLIEFHADWCGPCHIMAPVIEKIADEHKIELTKVDIDSDQETTRKYGVSSIPTVLLLEDGEEVARIIGAQPKKKIEAALQLTEEA